MKRISVVFIISLLVSLPVIAKDKAVFIRIVDGDTIVVNLDGKKEKIRLIGIDTPESKSNSKAFKDSQRSGDDIEVIVAHGKAASNFVKSLLKKGDILGLEYDAQRRDKYGRLLAYVYLPDGGMLNEKIIKSGYASQMTIPPNNKYQEKFSNAYNHARVNKLGLWE